MDDPFAPIRPGGLSPFVRSFSTVQKSMDLLRNLDRQNRGGEDASVVKPLSSNCKILIENQAELDLDPGSIVKIGAASTPYTGDDQYAFRDVPVYVGEVPGSTSDLFAILEEPAAATNDDGTFNYANAVFLGHAVCDIDITDDTHGYATPTASDCTKLTSATSGPARIIDKESSGTGTKRCTVKIDESGAAVTATSSIEFTFVSAVTCDADGLHVTTKTGTITWDGTQLTYSEA